MKEASIAILEVDGVEVVEEAPINVEITPKL
jgi:hypothetical protein